MSNYPTARIIKLAMYPAKGVAGIEIDSATLTPSGLIHGNYADHQFMIVSKNREFVSVNGKDPSNPDVYCFVTQRDIRGRHDIPQGLSVMAQIKPRFNGPKLELTWRYIDPIEVPYNVDSGRELPIKVWEHETYAVDQGDLLAEWLSDQLNLDVRLVKAAGSFQRLARQNYMPSDNPVYFHDAYPVHWFPIESVNELSEIAAEPIPWQSFRPQIVVERMPAQYEHKIFEGQIANIPFKQPKPCDRCPVTTIDQETGLRRGKTRKNGREVLEPLYTMQQYKIWIDRHGELKPIFGENMNPEDTGPIELGDRLTVNSERNPLIEYGSMDTMSKKLKAMKAARAI